MSREYKNFLRIRDRLNGAERRENLTKEVLKDSTPLPRPLEYKDIDEEFRRWVDEDLNITFEDSRVPTIVLFSNQRFSEYMQSWQNVDNKRNLLMNFKTISRENNPKSGNIIGQSKNIPGERTYLMQRIESRDRAGRKYYTDYRVKQPFAVDIIYTVSIVTSKYEMLNEFNMMVNDKFKAINCYIRPNGHFIPMKLNDISDESEYSIDNRQFYSQSYNITVMAYIMPEDSFIVEERPDVNFVAFEGDILKHSYAEIEELPCDYDEDTPYAYVPTTIKVHFEQCDSKYEFNIDMDFKVKSVTVENVRTYKFFINDEEIEPVEGLEFKNGDSIKIKGLRRYKFFEGSDIIIEGFDPRNVYKKSEGEEEKVIEYS